MATRNKSPRLSLQLTAEPGTDPRLLAPIRAHLKLATPLLPPHHLKLVVISLVSDETMSALHQRSHADPTPTDVLTYELDWNGMGFVTEGQIVLCLGEAQRHAAKRKLPVTRELLLYALHGLLHLCGMDDHKKKDFDQMHALEDSILTQIGVGATFAAKPSTPKSVTALAGKGRAR